MSRKSLMTMLAMAGASMMLGAENFYSPSRRSHDLDLNNDFEPEPPSPRPVKIVPDQLHEFSIQGHKVMAKSRQDAIKRLIREGLIKDKKKKRKNK